MDENHYKDVLSLVGKAKQTVWIGTADIKDLYVDDKPFLALIASLHDLQPTPPEFLHFDLMAGEVSHGLANSTDMIDGITKTNKQLARE
ncbi:MAG: hypothetical protein IJV09_04950 [Prevotella sp.]|nr:hypothetical protein [Prevotella sp.]